MAPPEYWSLPFSSLLPAMESGPEGLSQDEVEERLRRLGPNTLKTKRRATPLGLFLGQFKSPLILILIFAATVSAFFREWVDSIIVFSIVPLFLRG